MECPSSNAENRDGVRYCSNCGRLIKRPCAKASGLGLRQSLQHDAEAAGDRYGEGEIINRFEADVIAEARVWQRRHGGNLVQLYPYVLAAQKGFAERLGRMEAYCAKARAMAVMLSTFPQIEIVPNPPHTNMMHVFLRGELDKLREANLDIAQETGVWLLSWISPTAIPAYQKVEVTVGDATMDLSDEEIGELFGMLFEKAH